MSIASHNHHKRLPRGLFGWEGEEEVKGGAMGEWGPGGEGEGGGGGDG